MSTPPPTRPAEPRPARLHAQVLILLGASLFLGGGSGGTARLEDRVERVVREGARREAAREVALEIQRATRDTIEDLVHVRRDLLRVVADYDSTPFALVERLEQARQQLATHEEELIDLRFELRDAMTRDEWVELSRGLREGGQRMSEGWR